MNFVFHTMFDAAGELVLNVSFSQSSVSTVFR